jgi:hypothetical protein
MAIWRGLTDRGGAALGQDVGAGYVVARGDELLDVLDLDPLGLAVAHQVPDRRLGGLDADAGAGERRMGQEAVHRAFEIPPLAVMARAT